MTFRDELQWYVENGCIDYSKRLGNVKLPEGYALLLNSDHSHFFYIKADNYESCIHWSKWTVYRWIKEDNSTEAVFEFADRREKYCKEANK